MKIYTINKESAFLLALMIVLCLLIVLYVSIFVGVSMDLKSDEQYLKKRDLRLKWKDILKMLDHDFRFDIEVKGPILNTYPDEVTFILNEVHACDTELLVIALVVTAIQNHKRRHFIRNTWGHSAVVEKTGIKPLFAVGQPKHHKDQLTLEEESRQYKDILQANFIDDYRNLTYKTTAILHWARVYCRKVPIILKIDDDVIPNPFALSELLAYYLKSNMNPIEIMGKVRCCDPVLRVGKYAVSEEEYSGGQYPPYVAGPSYIVPSAIIPAILKTAKRMRFLPLEDVYTTGLVAKAAGIGHKNILSLTNSDGRMMDIRWCSGGRIFQENIGLKEAARGWNALLKVENISFIPEYVIPENVNS